MIYACRTFIRLDKKKPGETTSPGLTKPAKLVRMNILGKAGAQFA